MRIVFDHLMRAGRSAEANGKGLEMLRRLYPGLAFIRRLQQSLIVDSFYFYYLAISHCLLGWIDPDSR